MELNLIELTVNSEIAKIYDIYKSCMFMSIEKFDGAMVTRYRCELENRV